MTTNTTRSKTDSFASFGVNPIEEEVKETRSKTALSDRISMGNDDFVFRVNSTHSMAQRSSDLETLERLAQFLYTLFASSKINPYLAYLRDHSELIDEGLIEELNTLLKKEIISNSSEEVPNDWTELPQS